jgi:DNA-binding protein HU-beta
VSSRSSLFEACTRRMMGADMQQTKEMAKAGKRMGKKVIATDTAQDVVAVVVDGLEEVAVDKADDVAESVKTRAARAGGRSPKRASAGKTNARTKKSTAKKSTPKKSTAKRAGAKKSAARKSTAKKSTARKAGAKKSAARKSTAKKSTAKRR